jgi:hypothetical protein
VSQGCGGTPHFTREYKRVFGAPPMRDVERLREDAGKVAAYEPVGSR